MRLIATVGANRVRGLDHTYIINGESYRSELSFLALAKAYKIEDIILIGTDKSKESLKSILDNNPNIKMVVIDSTNIEDVFQKSLEYISQDTILDLTQGFRHYPMLTLLSAIFQFDTSKSVRDIFYAQTLDSNCNPARDECKFEFVSLIKYIDISNMARVINTFNKTLLTLDYDVTIKEFREIKLGLEEITKELFSNHFIKKGENKIRVILLTIDRLLDSGELKGIEQHLLSLKSELEKIQNLLSDRDSITLFNIARYFKEKSILLHSITSLYEAMVAFLDERVKNNECNRVKFRGKERVANTYQRRNCLKKRFKCREKYKRAIPKCGEFKELLKEIDILRNISAHAMATTNIRDNIDKVDLDKKLDEAIEFLSQIIK